MAKALQRLGSQANPHQALHTQHQRQSRGFIKTLLAEWAYAMAFQSSEEPKHWLTSYLGQYNGGRCNIDFSGLNPKQRLQLPLAE